jgi:hypothetical protein
MITVRLEGRLGNQLFQYVFICSTAKNLNTKFYVDEYIEHSLVNQYFKVNIHPGKITTWLFNINGFKNIFNFHLRRFYYQTMAAFYGLKLKEYDFSATVSDVEITDSTIYRGYFQSALFFKPHEDFIRQRLALKSKFKKQFNFNYADLYKNNRVIAVHIRRTDYKNQLHLNLGGADLSLPLSYYEKAIATFDMDAVHFVFIGDDKEFIKENFGYVKNKTIAAGTDIMDFQHLLNASGCIISNSTFSWWGAWLNNKPDKVIYAPQYFMGWRVKQEFPQSIYPDKWHIIRFDEE